uniref:Uncharacterized protein n=1 Tax=Knipowitschia caucasica TaxID=637954 RepID=A0AAV2MI13_KNICA
MSLMQEMATQRRSGPPLCSSGGDLSPVLLWGRPQPLAPLGETSAPCSSGGDLSPVLLWGRPQPRAPLGETSAPCSSGGDLSPVLLWGRPQPRAPLGETSAPCSSGGDLSPVLLWGRPQPRAPLGEISALCSFVLDQWIMRSSSSVLILSLIWGLFIKCEHRQQHTDCVCEHMVVSVTT